MKRPWRRRTRPTSGSTSPSTPPELNPDIDLIVSQIDPLARAVYGLASSSLRQYDVQIRGRYLTAPAGLHGWFRLGPTDVAEIVARSAEPVGAAALLSMHSNGFVRQAAVDALAGLDASQAFRFLVVRLGDWVPQVRDRAETAVMKLLPAVVDKHRLESLPLVFGMSAEQSRGSRWAVGVLRTIVASITTTCLVSALGHENLHVRHAAARELVQRSAADVALEAALEQPDPLTAHIVTQAVLAEHGATNRALVARILASKFAGPASEAAFMFIKDADDAEGVAISLLLDPRRPVRSVAQHEARRAAVNVPGFYRSHLDTGIALVGLGETGDRSDADLAAGYLEAPVARTRSAAVTAVGRLDPISNRGQLLDALDDPAPSVVRAAARAVVRCGSDAAVVDKVLDLLTNERDERDEHLDRAAWYIAVRLARWQRLHVVLACLASALPRLEARAADLLDRTLLDWNHSFTDPSERERGEIERLLGLVVGDLSQESQQLLELSLRPHGIWSQTPMPGSA